MTDALYTSPRENRKVSVRKRKVKDGVQIIFNIITVDLHSFYLVKQTNCKIHEQRLRKEVMYYDSVFCITFTFALLHQLE